MPNRSLNCDLRVLESVGMKYRPNRYTSTENAISLFDRFVQNWVACVVVIGVAGLSVMHAILMHICEYIHVEGITIMTADPRKIRRDFYLLGVDWVHLHTWLPTPPRKEGRQSKVREYGHPAEWASDTAAEIAALFTSWHDMLADHRSETPPPKGSEKTRVVAAWKYLEPRFDQLVTLVDREALDEVHELHQKISNVLGLNNPPQRLDFPCPNSSECENVASLDRIQGIGRDFISCGFCNYTVPEDLYPLLVRCALDAVIDELEGKPVDQPLLGPLSRAAVMLVIGRETTTIKQVAEHLNVIRRDRNMPRAQNFHVRKLLSRLVAAGYIQRSERGVYIPGDVTFANAA